MVSPIITPFRWYNKFYKQNRYDVDCSNTCEFKLITSRAYLLPFQFKREASGYMVDKWLLRSACVEAEPTLLTPQSSKFYGEMQWNNNGEWTFDCAIAKSGGVLEDELSIMGLLTPGKKYRITFSCSDLSRITGSDYHLTFNNAGTVVVDNINQIGYYEQEFTAVSANVAFVIQFGGGADPSDYIGISDVQIVELFAQNGDDIVLNKSLLRLKNFGAVDYIVYCGSNLGQSIPPGDYYSIITTPDGAVYYSEVITVRDFDPAVCEYYRLQWRNDCDLVDVVYNNFNVGCTYYNVLFLEEAVVTRPEYPFTEEGETDGNKTLKPTFQKWEKDIQFIIAKCPEFIVDAITGIRLHDNITLTRPARREQVQASESETIETVEYEITPVFDDCYNNVNLKLSLPDKYVDSACCSNNTLTECAECEYTVPTPPNDFTEDCEGCYAFAFDGEAPDGLYLWNGGDEQWDYYDVPAGTLVCVQDVTYSYNGDSWGLVLEISDITIPDFATYNIKGRAYPNSYVQAEYTLDEGATWIPIEDIISSDEFYDTGITETLLVPIETDIRFRVKNYTLNCDYGYSETYIYAP